MTEPEPNDEPAARTKQHRTWPQRLTLLAVCVGAFACFSAAGAIAAGQWVLSQRNLVTLGPAGTPDRAASVPDVVVPDQVDPDAPVVTTAPPATTVPLVLAEPEAANFLVVGADNNDCEGDRATDERDDIGERSDTIMVWRANPDTNQLAVLSFPRDLYVDYPSGNRRRINEAYRRDDPTRLQEVIDFNFGITIDHYVQIDFCAFRRLVDAVGGVAIPFQFPAKDLPSSGAPPNFLVEETGCVNLDGITALNYVRARHYYYEDPPGSGNWEQDPSSDFGRIRRQQDFLRRVLKKVIDDGLYDPDVAGALITTNREYLTTDADLTLRRMLEFANALRNFNADSVASYRIESSSFTTSDGQQVEIPRIKNDNMRAILAVFRGEAALASAPEQVEQTTTSTSVAAAGTATTTTTTTPDDESADSDDDATTTTLPVVEATENPLGIAPDPNVSCD